MLMPHRKKIASIIVGTMSKDKGESDPSDFVQYPEDSPKHEDEDPGLEAVAQDMLKAIRSQDAKGFADLLKHFFYMCDDDSGEESEEME